MKKIKYITWDSTCTYIYKHKYRDTYRNIYKHTQIHTHSTDNEQTK